MRNENIYKMIKNLKNHIVTRKPEYDEKKNKTKNIFLKDFLLYAILRDKKNIHNCAHKLELAKNEIKLLINDLETYINSYDDSIKLEKKGFFFLRSKKYYDSTLGFHIKEDLIEVLEMLKKSFNQIGELK